jgi:hypothetical protein
MDTVGIASLRMSPTWLFVLPAFLIGMAVECTGSAQPPCPVGSAAEIHYSPAEDLERIDVALIGGATKQVDMAAYVLTDEPLSPRCARSEGASLARRERSGEADLV